MKKEIFCEENIVLNAKYENKWGAIRACGQILVDNGYVTEDYVDNMIAREKEASIYIGNHVAIPHGVANSERNIIVSGISFLQVPEGVAFGDDDVAYMFIGIAGRDDKHINILSTIATVCSDMENIKKLREATDKKVIYDIFSDIKAIG